MRGLQGGESFPHDSPKGTSRIHQDCMLCRNQHWLTMIRFTEWPTLTETLKLLVNHQGCSTGCRRDEVLLSPKDIHLINIPSQMSEFNQRHISTRFSIIFIMRIKLSANNG